jgi:hypothetical protein
MKKKREGEIDMMQDQKIRGDTGTRVRIAHCVWF